jgi:hypothetical protein
LFRGVPLFKQRRVPLSFSIALASACGPFLCDSFPACTCESAPRRGWSNRETHSCRNGLFLDLAVRRSTTSVPTSRDRFRPCRLLLAWRASSYETYLSHISIDLSRQVVKESLTGWDSSHTTPFRAAVPARPPTRACDTRDRARATSIGHRLLSVVTEGRHARAWPYKEEQVMGSRDKRGREKKKPKKQQTKPVTRPLRPATAYKPAAPPPPSSQTEEGTGE